MFVVPVRSTVTAIKLVFSATLMVVKVKFTAATSSSVIVRVLVPVPMVVFVALFRTKRNCSVFSWRKSSVMLSVIVFVVTPGAKTKRPLVAM